ncbi:hypothetical protein LOTGIDRAFT_176013 [Lottia gigantea]|uniref:Concentrative nucleoside transporter C-terminal domain-containing protein n=1 Tax=Lottia gigantea TaxID=225164 RepID=V3ZZP0_LOTGI|nr:hypothetical protein LOTGIDRAFT_176013 [Lottia gigantea]ESO86466.1 hypothetical protein LOTGIDRAFT_176013 [Lottia gigantea]
MKTENSDCPLMSSSNDSTVKIELCSMDTVKEVEQLKAVGEKCDVQIDIETLESKESGNSKYTRVEEFVSSHIRKVVMIIAVVIYLIYFITALVFGATRECVNTTPLIVLTCLILAYFLFGFIMRHFGENMKEKGLDPCVKFLNNKQRILKGLFVFLALGGILVVIIATGVYQPRNLISVVGYLFFVLILFLFSEHRKQLVCSYLFKPVAFLMGVEWNDAGSVGELIGIKTFLNEFVAYEKLAEFIKNREDCLDGVSLSIKSEVISTYALCGFANLSSIGIQLGGLTPMAPNRASDLASVVIKALFGGIIACLMTASIAGKYTKYSSV